MSGPVTAPRTRRRTSRRTPSVDTAAAKLQVVINGTSCQPRCAVDDPSLKRRSVTA